LLSLLPLAALALLALAAPAGAAGPAPLSDDRSTVDVSSSAGGGIFGRWVVDRFGVPAYRYLLDPDRDPRTRQPELKGSATCARPADA
jgi:hypothetical protein